MPGEEATVEARLRRLEDLEEIRRLFMEYRRRLDEKDFPGYAGLFAEDGELIAGDYRARGHDEILGVLHDMLGRDLGERSRDDFHVVANPSIELDGDRATAASTWVYVVREEDGNPRVAMLGHYDDVLRREGGRWLFERRDAALDIPAR